MGRNQNDVRIRQSARREDDVCPELLDVRSWRNRVLEIERNAIISL
jgi:hypothetical protein